MSLNLPASEISMKGVKLSSLTADGFSSIKKPQGFQYNPIFEQRRVPGFDADGNRTPGTPVVIGKDYSLSLSFGQFNPEIADKLSDDDVCDQYFDYSATFSDTMDGTLEFDFEEPCLVLNGNYSLDPLGEGMTLNFTCMKRGNMVFAA